MNKKVLLIFVLTLLLALSVSIAFADDTDLDGDYPWRGHAAPLDFKFGNMIDSHQQSFVKGLVQEGEGFSCPDKSDCQLKGFIYIHDTGAVTDDGFLMAEKAHCPTGTCMVGWVVKGVYVAEATLVNKSPRIWMINPEDIPGEPGYSHFHWLGEPKSPHDLVVGETYSGYLMKRIAATSFFWLGGPGSGGGGGDGGCGGHDTEGGGGCTDGGEDDGCSGSGGMEGSPGGGCSEGDTGCTDGGHDTPDDGGCTDGGEDDGCSAGGGEDHGGGSSGRYVYEGLDSHSNIVTPDEWDGTWHGGCHDD